MSEVVNHVFCGYVGLSVKSVTYRLSLFLQNIVLFTDVILIIFKYIKKNGVTHIEDGY